MLVFKKSSPAEATRLFNSGRTPLQVHIEMETYARENNIQAPAPDHGQLTNFSKWLRRGGSNEVGAHADITVGELDRKLRSLLFPADGTLERINTMRRDAVIYLGTEVTTGITPEGEKYESFTFEITCPAMVNTVKSALVAFRHGGMCCGLDYTFSHINGNWVIGVLSMRHVEHERVSGKIHRQIRPVVLQVNLDKHCYNICKTFIISHPN